MPSSRSGPCGCMQGAMRRQKARGLSLSDENLLVQYCWTMLHGLRVPSIGFTLSCSPRRHAIQDAPRQLARADSPCEASRCQTRPLIDDRAPHVLVRRPSLACKLSYVHSGADPCGESMCLQSSVFKVTASLVHKLLAPLQPVPLCSLLSSRAVEPRYIVLLAGLTSRLVDR